MITLNMQPQTPPMSWKQFCNTTEPYSIAIDGFVSDAPKKQLLKAGGPRANFNHHERVSRLETRATCAQALMAVRMGLFDIFRKDGAPHATIYANDCDQDVCTAWFVLKYGWMCQNVINPLLNKLVSMEDLLDSTAGAYPFPKDLPLLQSLAWVFEPYTDFRLEGGLNSRDGRQFTGVVTEVEERIMKFILGQAQSIPLDIEYDVIGGGKNWKMVKEIGAQARTGMFSDGIRAFVSVRERQDGRFNYTFGRMSDYVDFPVAYFGRQADKTEGLINDHWGGATNIWGSPRVNGSKHNPDEIQRIVNNYY